jgi:NAD(P)-dependent dehydrogenase (short-subunit alcohol dehydrogenase family)
MSTLAGRTALVSGGARGLGRAIAAALVEAGADVTIVDSGVTIAGEAADPSVVGEAAAAIGARGLAVSVASPAAAAAAVAAVPDRFDILIHAAAILRDGFVFKADPFDFDAVLRTSLHGGFYLTRAAADRMRTQAKDAGGQWPSGRIVHLISTAGLYGNYGQAAYAAAKAGLVGLMRATALDLRRIGVTANCVAPFGATRVTDSIRPQTPAQEAYKAAALSVPAADVGALVAWLASDEAGGVSGQIFGVRGREVMLFNQARPIARAVVRRQTPLGPQLAGFIDHLTPLEADLDAFSGDPLI